MAISLYILTLIILIVVSEKVIWIDSQDGNDDNDGSEALPKRSLNAALDFGFLKDNNLFIELKCGVYFASTNLINDSLGLRSLCNAEVISNSTDCSYLCLNDSYFSSSGILFMFDDGSLPLLSFVGMGKSVVSGLKVVCSQNMSHINNAVIVIENGYGILENVIFYGLVVEVSDNIFSGLIVVRDFTNTVICANCSLCANIVNASRGSVIFVGRDVRFVIFFSYVLKF
jgi:hypothetical protein